MLYLLNTPQPIPPVAPQNHLDQQYGLFLSEMIQPQKYTPSYTG